MNRLAAILSFGLLLALGVTAIGQAPATGMPEGLTEGNPVRPRMKPPVEQFRELLALSPEQRKPLLAGKPEAHRRVIEAKLTEYEALPLAERELRLQITELRWYLLPLLKSPPFERAPGLANVPSEQRKLVEERLQEWDRLPAPMQKELLEHEMVLDYFARLEISTPAQQEAFVQGLNPEYRDKLEQEIARWRGLSSEQRQRVYSHFNQFFQLNEMEKDKILAHLSDTERTRAVKTLANFEKLPPETRAHYLDSFQRFSSLTPGERQLFLKSAKRWGAMSAPEREAWRNLFTQLPPLPPGLELNNPPLPAPVLPPGD